MASLSQGRHVNRTYTNPIIPGWNSDPSCTFVSEWDETFFCTVSSFLAFPGIPVYASKDLTNWKLASNALTRPDQVPEMSSNGQQNEGIWASTIRYHEGTFYLITSYISFTVWAPKILLFKSTNPFDDASWSDPVTVQNPANDIDPDIFWDNGKVYMAVAAGIWISEIDVETGAATEPFRVWNGTGDRNPEGPHLYDKDGYYYLLIGEGGTETNHTATIARSQNVHGPYEGYEGNPLLTAKNTDNYFQTVGHADLFQDASGNWWACALATRSGPNWEVYPMGRETVLAPVTWKDGEWPVADQVFGKMSGPLPPVNKHVSGDGPWVDEPDVLDFPPGSSMPKQFVHWRPQDPSLFTVSAEGHPNSLQIAPSTANLTGGADFDPTVDSLSFVGRRQSATLFDFSVDISFSPTAPEEEAGISVFLTQFQHMDLGVVNLASTSGNSSMPHLRFRVEASGKPDETAPETNIVSIPQSWLKSPIRLSASAKSDTEYIFTAASTASPRHAKFMGSGPASIVSGGTGPFSGTLVGAYATSNGGNGTAAAYLSRWRYIPIAQEIADGEFVRA